jgi:spore coat polysaccharide biosynthesis protein SpsF (cytidylyltransferase family)
MKNFIFLQARMGSSRLPGKTLKLINNKPLIEYVIERLKITGIEIIVLTTDSKKDDILEEWCENYGIKCFRGSEENVLERYYLAAKLFNADNIIRATADNPLVEPYFCKRLLEKHIKHEVDYSSNKSEIGSNLPDGLGVEIFTFEALEISYKKSSLPYHFEHVNEYILENQNKFYIYKDCNAGGFKNYSHIRLTVDTIGDFNKVEKILSSKNFNISIKYEDLLELIR